MARLERFALSNGVIDTAELISTLSNAAAGACVTFEGRVRDNNEGRQVESLEYEAYSTMAMSEGKAIVQEAITRFGVIDACCVHRTGHLAVGEVAVWVGVIAGHRDEAFAACRYIIDEAKARIPIWKKEHYTDNTATWIVPSPSE